MHAWAIALLALLLAGCDSEEDDTASETDADTDADTDVDTDADADDTGTADADGDGWTVADGDCDDGDPRVHPRALDDCGDGIDQDCDGSDPACRFEGEVTLGDLRIVQLTGETGWDEAGWSLAGPGDVDADGHADLLIGAPARMHTKNEGGACLLYGPVTEDRSLALADARLFGDDWEKLAGLPLAGAGDVDGDGFADLLIGAPYHSEPFVHGVAYLVLGPVPVGDLDLSLADARLLGDGRISYAGWSVAGAGDTDGDGCADVLVRAHISGVGQVVYLVRGPVAGDVGLSDAEARLDSEEENDRAGDTLTGVGDVDGDGLDDVLVGAHQSDLGGTMAGAAYLLYGPLSGERSLTDADARLLGLNADDRVGWAVAGPGDVDGDGHADLLIGAWGVDTGVEDAGAAYLLYGPLGRGDTLAGADATLVGGEAGVEAGWDVEGAGDLDEDGFADVLVTGSTEEGGTVFLVYGPVEASLDLSTADATFVAEDADDRAGRALAGPGDVDGDGHADILIGAPGSDDAGDHAGAAYLVPSGLVW